jgi:hypothetical protein
MMLLINIPIVDIKIMLFRLNWQDVAAWKPSQSWIFFRYHNIMEVEGMARDHKYDFDFLHRERWNYDSMR